MWLLLILLAVLCFSVARILQKKLLILHQIDSISYAIYFQLLVVAILLPFALFTGFTIPSLTLVWLPLLLMTIFYAFANIFSYYSIKTIPLSEFMIILATVPIWAAVTSIPLLGERVSLFKVLGILLTFIGLCVAFYERREITLHRGHMAALLTAIFSGLAFTNGAFLLKHFNALSYTIFYFLLPAIFIALIYPKKILGINKMIQKKSYKAFFLASLLFAIAIFCTNTSYLLGGEISQISTLVQLNTLVTLLLGIVFLQDRTNIAKKLLGSAIVIIGAILVSLP